VGPGWTSLPDGAEAYVGERPGPRWHVHGWTRRQLWLLRSGRLVRVIVWKRRWRLAGSNRTCHSRPPEEVPRLAFAMIVVLLALADLLAGPLPPPGAMGLPAGHRQPARRRVQRWLRRALATALQLQVDLRRAIIERCEPRPVEQLFPGGVSPPPAVRRRPWADPGRVTTLVGGLELLLGGASKLQTSLDVLLAEARRRNWSPTPPFPI